MTEMIREKELTTAMLGVCQGSEEPAERDLKDQSWNNLSNKINKIALD